jgi:hypothetical protein
VTEISSDVCGIRRPLEIGLMTCIAVHVNKLVIAADMARLARCRNMRSGESEFCYGMIETCRRPGRCGVAGRTVVTEIARHMIRICCGLEIGLVTLITILVDELIVAAQMTRLTGGCRMLSGQRESRRRVIERRRCPGDRRMARLAQMIELCGDVVRIRRLVEIRLVTSIAIGIDKLEIVAGMTGSARHCNVPSGEGERCRRMVE